MNHKRFLRGTGTMLLIAGLLAGCASKPDDKESLKGKLPTDAGPSLPPPPPAPTGVALNPALRGAAERELAAAASAADAVIRAHAVEATREALGSGGRAGILKSLSDPEPMVQFAGAMAAGEMRLAEARPLLQKLVNSKNPHVQVGAIFALHRLGDVRYSAGLEEALKSPTPEVRANAAFALGRLGEKSAVRILRPAMKDNSVEVRLQAAEALWRLGDEEGLKYLVAAGLSRNPAHQMVGILALAGPRDRRVIEHVRAGLGSDYTEVVLVTARALGMLGSDEAFQVAMNQARSAEMRQRYLAALALGAIGRADAQDTLAALLKDANPDVRVASATAILQLH